MRESRRYLGLELAGAKNQKTALAALEYYPKENKIFVLDLFDRVVTHSKSSAEHGGHGSHGDLGQQSSDEALLELIHELGPNITKIGVNVSLQLPPCIACVRKQCETTLKCNVPAVKWMRDFTKKMDRHPDPEISEKVRDFTPYTQRPIELWARYQIMTRLPASHRFEIDETLGGNRAPLTARMHFLKRHLHKYELAEVWPKLTVAVLAIDMGISKRTVSSYRRLEEGNHAREEILEALTKSHGIFIYERDVRKLSHSLTSFDAFFCAYTALLADTQRCAKAPTGFPIASGWVEHPLLPTQKKA